MGEVGSQAVGGRDVVTAGSPFGARLLQNWMDAHDRGLGYLAALDVATT